MTEVVEGETFLLTCQNSTWGKWVGLWNGCVVIDEHKQRSEWDLVSEGETLEIVELIGNLKFAKKTGGSLPALCCRDQMSYNCSLTGQKYDLRHHARFHLEESIKNIIIS